MVLKCNKHNPPRPHLDCACKGSAFQFAPRTSTAGGADAPSNGQRPTARLGSLPPLAPAHWPGFRSVCHRHCHYHYHHRQHHQYHRCRVFGVAVCELGALTWALLGFGFDDDNELNTSPPKPCRIPKRPPAPGKKARPAIKKSRGGEVEEQLNKKPPTPSLWQAPASTQKINRKTSRGGISTFLAYLR